MNVLRFGGGFVLAGLLYGAGVADAAVLRINENDAVVDGVGWFSWAGDLQTGSTIWFDVLIDEGLGESAEGVQITLSVQPDGHLGSLGFDQTASEAVEADVGYWVVGNSIGANASDEGGNTYAFGDNPDDPPSAVLEDGDIVARFAFTWDGVAGDYVVAIDRTTANTHLLQNFVTVPPDWVADPVRLMVPEPGSLTLLAAAGTLLFLRGRQSRSVSSSPPKVAFQPSLAAR
jgi:hypothetical protein